MKVIDYFPFFDELDMLEARLTELDGVVDRFVAVEATTTHRGEPKPAYLELHASRFARFSDRLVRLVVEPPDTDDPWVRERYQRDQAASALADAEPDDLVLSCDVDEIVRRDSLAAIAEATRGGPVCLGMAYHCFSLRLLDPTRTWLHPKAFRAKDLPASLSELRLRPGLPVVPDAGWHLSWFGDDERLVRKVKSFAHAEYDTPEIATPEFFEAARAGGVTINGTPLVEVDPGRVFPPRLVAILGDARRVEATRP
jgi:hypothetical protein